MSAAVVDRRDGRELSDDDDDDGYSWEGGSIMRMESRGGSTHHERNLVVLRKRLYRIDIYASKSTRAILGASSR